MLHYLRLHQDHSYEPHQLNHTFFAGRSCTEMLYVPHSRHHVTYITGTHWTPVSNTGSDHYLQLPASVHPLPACLSTCWKLYQCVSIYRAKYVYNKERSVIIFGSAKENTVIWNFLLFFYFLEKQYKWSELVTMFSRCSLDKKITNINKNLFLFFLRKFKWTFSREPIDLGANSHFPPKLRMPSPGRTWESCELVKGAVGSPV